MAFLLKPGCRGLERNWEGWQGHKLRYKRGADAALVSDIHEGRLLGLDVEGEEALSAMGWGLSSLD